MSRVIEVPDVLDHKGFEVLIRALNEVTQEGAARVLFNAKHVRWTSPYGLIGLLAAGRVARERTGFAPSIEAPDNREVRGYWERMDFWHVAPEVYDLEPVPARAHGSSDALLEITPIRSHHDVHTVVERVRERAATILLNKLHYTRPSVIQFSVLLSEVCQNIIEHAEADGWVCAQTYNYRERLGRDVVQLAVMDVGIGFEGSLSAEHSRRHGERWSAGMALERALLHGESRHRDPGRGQGLQAIRRQVDRWQGELGIRSGDAMIASPTQEWGDLAHMQTGLEKFPGAQILVVMPAHVENE